MCSPSESGTERAPALLEPDPLRLSYRDVLIAVVSDIVRSGSAITPPAVRQLAGTSVAPADMNAFVAMAINELLQLHEGNIARYRLRPSEFQEWQKENDL
ncbi:MAG: hypothetical protein J5I81_11360 [Nitrococcus mobilis]|nr:hypothetical protein [Nitrococcus mobilis]